MNDAPKKWSWRRIKAEERRLRSQGIEAPLMLALSIGHWCSNPYCWADGFCKSGCEDRAKVRRADTMEDLVAHVDELQASLDGLMSDLKRFRKRLPESKP